MARGLTIYLTIIGWLLWAFTAGFYTLRFPLQGLEVNLPFAAVLTFLLFVDLFGLWVIVRKKRPPREIKKEVSLSAAPEEPTAREPVPGGEGEMSKVGAHEGVQETPLPQTAKEGSVFRYIFPSLAEGGAHDRREVLALGLLSVLFGAALFATNAFGRPLLQPGTGSVKMAIALSLSVWLFLEPIPEGQKRGILAARTGIGFGLLCFAADLWAHLFGVAGVLAGALAIFLGRWGAGLYAILITLGAWALQWTGRAGGPWE